MQLHISKSFRLVNLLLGLTFISVGLNVHAENIPNAPWLPAGNGWIGHTRLDVGLSTNFNDLTNWTTDTKGWAGRYPGIFRPNTYENSYTSNGELILRTQQTPGSTQTWNQGYVRSNWRVKGGIFQARIAFPQNSPAGVSGAFWLQNIDRVDGINYEFDIQELVPNQNGDSSHYHELSTNIHALNAENNDTWGGSGGEMTLNLNLGSSWWASNYHTYTFEWNTTSAFWYVDGVKKRGMWLDTARNVGVIESWSGSQKTIPRATFDALLGNSMYVIFDQEIFESWAGKPTSAGPWDMKVDYFARWEWQ